MDKVPRSFTLGEEELRKLLEDENAWRDDLCRVTFVNDPDWVGYVRRNGTGLALLAPSHLDILNLRAEMRGDVMTTPASFDSPREYWAI